MFLVAAVIWGAAHGLLMPSLLSFALERAGAASSRVVATFFAVSDAGVFLGPPLMGGVVRLAGYSAMFLCLSAVCLVSLLYFLYFTRAKSGPTSSCSGGHC